MPEIVCFAGKSWPLGIQVVASGNSFGISGNSGDSGEMGEASAPQTPLPHAPEARMTVVYTGKLPQIKGWGEIMLMAANINKTVLGICWVCVWKYGKSLLFLPVCMQFW